MSGTGGPDRGPILVEDEEGNSGNLAAFDSIVLDDLGF